MFIVYVKIWNILEIFIVNYFVVSIKLFFFCGLRFSKVFSLVFGEIDTVIEVFIRRF